MKNALIFPILPLVSLFVSYVIAYLHSRVLAKELRNPMNFAGPEPFVSSTKAPFWMIIRVAPFFIVPTLVFFVYRLAQFDVMLLLGSVVCAMGVQAITFRTTLNQYMSWQVKGWDFFYVGRTKAYDRTLHRIAVWVGEDAGSIANLIESLMIVAGIVIAVVGTN